MKYHKSFSEWLWDNFLWLWIPAILALILLGLWLNSVGCDARFDLPTRWTLMGGCQVHTSAGWIPADNYRMVD